MPILIDTCILRELHMPRPFWRVKRAVDDLWMEDIYLSVVSLAIMESGATRLPQEFKQRRVRGWIRTVQRKLGARLLGIDPETALIWGQVMASAKRRHLSLPYADGLIVASAKQHRLTVMTQNVGSFAPFQIEVFNPWGDPKETAYDFGDEPETPGIQPGSTSAELALPDQIERSPPGEKPDAPELSEASPPDPDIMTLPEAPLTMQPEPSPAEPPKYGRRASDRQASLPA